MAKKGLTRREVLQRGSLLALPGVLATETVGAASEEASATLADPGGLQVGPEIYESIGVRPLVNARGTYTILSGSLMLPEVRDAMSAAARQYVHLDELAEGRLRSPDRTGLHLRRPLGRRGSGEHPGRR